MTRQSIHEYAAALRPRYAQAGKRERGHLLDEFCATTGYHRKAAVRLLRAGPQQPHRPPGRPRTYGAAVVAVLEEVWLAGNQLCGKRLAPFLPELVASLERHGELSLPAEVREPLLTLSAATIDRLLAPARQRQGRVPLRQTTAHAALQLATPLRIWSEWDTVTPGSVQVDLVHHGGPTTAGSYLTTLTLVDVATGWHLCRAVEGLAKQRVQGACSELQRQLPFALRELHTDNGGEFLNETLVAWCTREGIRRTRGRPYRKNDQAYVEQRNWTAVRQLIGYDRYSGPTALVRLQRVYDLAARYQNYFQPVRKLVAREREGATVRKRFDLAQTPYQRLLASEVLSAAQREAVTAAYERLNPVQLRRQLETALAQLWAVAEHPDGCAPRSAPRSTHSNGNSDSEAPPVAG